MCLGDRQKKDRRGAVKIDRQGAAVLDRGGAVIWEIAKILELILFQKFYPSNDLDQFGMHFGLFMPPVQF